MLNVLKLLLHMKKFLNFMISMIYFYAAKALANS